MRLAYIQSTERGLCDRLLSAVAQDLVDAGVSVVGVAQSNTSCGDDDGKCDMDVTVLPDGPVIRISQSLGENSRGCRLDPNALEQSVGETLARLSRGGVQLLIVNKFGKHEADGRGFRPVIAEALSAGVPVLTAVGTLNTDAFTDFADGAGERIDPTPLALRDWIEDAITSE